MKTKTLIAVIAAATLAPTLALAQATTATGAVGGAAAGAVVGGPVGAVVGGTVGAVVGSAAEPPREVVTYVEGQQIPSATVEERVVVGEALPSSVELRVVPEHTEWRYAVVNNQRVIVQPSTRKVVRIIN